jgi:hypothetical protein
MRKGTNPARQRVGRFAIKARVYTSIASTRPRHLNGPWGATVHEAIDKFATYIRKNYGSHTALYDVFVAKSVPYGTAGANDGTYDYVSEPINADELRERMRGLGLRPESFASRAAKTPG